MDFNFDSFLGFEAKYNNPSLYSIYVWLIVKAKFLSRSSNNLLEGTGKY